MTTQLGLDIGTNSIGWCLFRSSDQGELREIVDIGVRIFGTSPQGAGRDPKSGASLAVDRREARAMRRRRDRYLGRRRALANELVKRGLLPNAATQSLQDEDPYTLRVRALDEELTPHQLGRALFHLNQRRGFKSNRKADRVQNDNESGKIATGSKALDQAMAEQGSRTLGEFLLERERKRVRMRADDKEYDFYPDRKHYLEEFDAIWSAQAAHHPQLLNDDARAAVHRIIFYQRPLKPQVVGKCSFAGWYGIPEDEKRLAKAHPLFQQRRLYEEVNQLEVVTAGAPSRKLTLDERNALIMKLQDKKKVSFKTLGTIIKLREDERFNKESENRKDLLGDELRAEMGDKKRFGGRWGEFSVDEQAQIVEKLLHEENSEVLLDWLTSRYNLDEEQAEAIANANLPEGYGRFGLIATKALLQQLKTDVITYSEAAERAGFHHSDFRDGEEHRTLPYYGEILAREIAPGKEDYSDELERQWGKITNPTVHIGLNQLRKLANAIVKKHGRPDYIYVELARELNLNDEQKREHNKRIKQNTKAAEARSEKLLEIGQRNTGANRALLRIWEQLNPKNPLDRRCPYCGELISIEMLMNGSADIDHIIPYSRCLDDGIGNKVASHTHCNREKGKKTPWEKWGGTDRWPVIQDQVARLHKSKQWRFSPEAMERVDRDGGFIARQLTDTQYLSKAAAKYLSALYTPDEGRRVYAVTGQMTAMLRRLWGLNELLPDHNWVENEHSNAPKNRLDHRHHAIDAAVVGATDAGMIQKIATAAGRAEDQNLDRLFRDLVKPWDGFRDDLREALYSTTISFKPDHGQRKRPSRYRDVTAGQLHNETAYGFTGRTNSKGMPLVVTRKPLLSIQPKDLTDPDRMPNHDLQDALYNATQGTSGKEFEQALRKFGEKPGPFQGIRRVRLTEPLNVIAIRNKDGKAYKGVKGDANARFDVWRLPDGKWVTKWKDREGEEHSSVISMFDAHQRDFVSARPHPAAKKVLSLQQNDMLAIERNGGAPEIVRVVKFSGSGSMQLAPNNEAGPLKARDAENDDTDPFKYINTSASGLKKMKARQVWVDELGEIHDPGPRD